MAPVAAVMISSVHNGISWDKNRIYQCRKCAVMKKRRQSGAKYWSNAPPPPREANVKKWDIHFLPVIIWHQQYFDVKVGATESMRNLISYQVQLEKKVFCFCLKSKLESCAAEQKKNTAKSISTINWSQQIHHLLHYKTVIILYSRKNPTDFKINLSQQNR